LSRYDRAASDRRSQHQTCGHSSAEQAGDAYNVMPQTAVIRGTFQTFSNETMKLIEDGMRRILRASLQPLARQPK
jgi:metal-dependent amidase/aminoacylase/carboxypeptidase family protein